ncbi:SbcC/MukB-like Walker B domain-containing protein [Verrucomicrobiota bacterium sgz303538]
MQSRKIELTRLHALNWFGYRDTFEITGNLLVAGVTGSGKSVLMDLLQLILIGHQQKVRYNQSATGDRSTRDLKSYCLGDTKQDVDGAPQFMRNGGITYVAMEFTWPDRKRVETWGLRIEFESAAQQSPQVKPFMIPAALKRDDFLYPDRTPLDYPAFRDLAESHKGVDGQPGRIFHGIEEYRREMALPSHLNFDRPTLDYLLPAAMSFTFMDDFNSFCRRYILPVEQVDITSVKDSYLVFRNLQTELALLRDQLDRLERVSALDQERTAAERDRLVTRYLEAELRRDNSKAQCGDAAIRLQALEAELASEDARLKELEVESAALTERIDSLKIAFNESGDGRLYQHLRLENQRLAREIERLREISREVATAIEARVRNTEIWSKQLTELPVRVEPSLINALQGAADRLAKATGESVRSRAREISATVMTTLHSLREATRPLESKNHELEQRVGALREQIESLRIGKPAGNTNLLDALNARLPRRGNEQPANALWQLCEVVDERWRPALEVVFNRKFAIVVGARDYDEAERIYHELRIEATGESLINPDQALAARRECRKGSLAEKLQTADPVARAIVDQLFGDVICVERREELREHNRAILPDGFMMQRPFVQRPRHYDHRPCIGRRGLEKQRAWLQSQVDELRAQQAQFAPALHAVHQAQEFARHARLDSENIHDELASVARLPELEEKLQINMQTLNDIRSTDLEQKQQELLNSQNRMAELQRSRDALMRSERRHELRLEQERSVTLQAEADKMEVRFREVCDSVDVSAYLPRVDEIRAEMLEKYPMLEQCAERMRDRYHESDKQVDTAWMNVVVERRALALAHEPKYHDFDPESRDNTRYVERLQKIRGSEIRMYEDKAKQEEKNWQQLFRVQVLEKLRAALERVADEIALLNQELRRREIGHDRYQITRRDNPDGEYTFYRRLLTLAEHVRPDELLFADADSELREGIESLFQTLVQQPDSAAALAFLDYRNYHDYDMEVTDVRDPSARPASVNRHSGKFSGGENQSPYFIAILACYLRAYRRFQKLRPAPSLAIVPIDEAFSKLSGERIRDCITALKQLDLQGVFSMSSGNIPYAIDHCDQVITVHKEERTEGKKKRIRNIAVMMTRESALKRFKK